MSQSASTAVKHRQLTHLAQQLQRLNAQVDELESITVTTAEQAAYMRLLGGYHASWFMAAGRIMTGDAPSPQQAQE